MGMYLILYFVSLVLALSFYFSSAKNKNKTYENLGVFFMLLMLFFFAFALYTKDPIDELLTTIPAFWQFVLTSLGGAFTLWKVYLNPLKEKVYGIDKEVATVQTKVATIETEVSAIKTTVNRVESEVRDSFARLENKMGKKNSKKL